MADSETLAAEAAWYSAERIWKLDAITLGQLHIRGRETTRFHAGPELGQDEPGNVNGTRKPPGHSAASS